MLFASWADVQQVEMKPALYERPPQSQLVIQTAGVWGVNLLNPCETAMTYSSRMAPGCDINTLIFKQYTHVLLLPKFRNKHSA